MTTELLLSLLGLALVDSLSAGTLLIPIFFLLAPGRIRLGRILTYLATIASFYFLVGLILTAGASVFLENATAVLETPAAYAVQLVLGAGLLAVAILMPTKKKVPVGAEVTQGGQIAQGGQVAQGGQDGQVTQGGQDGQIAQGGQDGEVTQRAQGGVTHDMQGPSADLAPARGRLARWRERALGSGSPATVIVLALAAGLIELATMIPYLAAVGLLTGSGLGFGGSSLLLAVYCVVMIVPALLLLFARVAARRTVEPPLRRLADWLSRNAAENTAWIIGIVGFLLLRDALSHSASFDFWPFNT
ncbi:GAP family protein [Pseudoclavibacter sp. AY1F1]|uniref:GAP family protein n=1 Tax=Pseudoclavibacter sp. AY1F1 TaxID=2080583 RepID=UPI0015E43388|nr:GAP family protein [Pseudoclavibacter sp. AY1F1]